jgi:ATP-dependent protease ClpP protease subunit
LNTFSEVIMTANHMLLRSIPERRKLWLRGKVTEKRAQKLIADLKRLNRGRSPILLMVSSRGGSLQWSLELYKAIQASRVPVYALISKAYSGAAIAVQACTMRFGRKKSLYNIHYNYGSLTKLRLTPRTDTEALKVFLDEKYLPFLREMWNPANEVLTKTVQKTGKTSDELERLLREDRIMSAEEALSWGLIDEVVRI